VIYGGTGYKVLLVLHLLSVIVAFGPWFLNGLLPSAALKHNDQEGKAISGATFQVSNASQFAMYGVFIFGMGVLGARAKGSGISMSNGWVIGSIVGWVAIIGILHALVLPAQRQLKDGTGDRAALTQRQSLGAALINVLVIVVVILMVFTPGK
jgi:uncharacterized membrane protein